MTTMTMHLSPPRPAQLAQPAVPALARHDLVVRGVLDATTVLQLRELVGAATQDRPALILVDVTAVTSVTPSGLVGVIELLRLSRSRGGDLRLWGASTTVIDAQLMAELTTITRVYGGRLAALEAGRRPVPARASTKRMLGALRVRSAQPRDTSAPTAGAQR